MDGVDYQKKKGAKSLLMDKTLSHTSETRAGQPSTTSIPDFGEKINPSAKKSSRLSFYNKQSQKVIAVLDFAWQSSGRQHNFKQLLEMNGYNTGLYNVIVTTYKPDSFDSYLANNEIVYDKQKMNGRYQVGSGRIVTSAHDTPFATSIPDSGEKINPL